MNDLQAILGVSVGVEILYPLKEISSGLIVESIVRLTADPRVTSTKPSSAS